MDNFEKWFSEYAAETRGKISGWADMSAVLDEFDLKAEHSYLVKERCVEIAEWLNLSENDCKLATIAGLYHDLGRFCQALEYGTMDDRITGCHGSMSADIFLKVGLKEGLTEEEIKIIADVIRYHNQYKLPEYLSDKTLYLSKIIRDADKLDIFRFYTDCIDKKEKRSYRFIISTKEGDYSPDMLEGILSGKNLHVSGIRNKKDRKLMQISLIYDIHFGYSFKWLLEKDYLAILTGINNGTADDVMKQIYSYTTNWMKERVEIRQKMQPN